jgi:hypothetical protein
VQFYTKFRVSALAFLSPDTRHLKPDFQIQPHIRLPLTALLPFQAIWQPFDIRIMTDGGG